MVLCDHVCNTSKYVHHASRYFSNAYLFGNKTIFLELPPTQDDSHQRFLMAFSVGEISHLEGGASGHTPWNGKAMLAVKSASNQRMNAKAMVTQEMP